jgi:predicted transcriptional regulator
MPAPAPEPSIFDETDEAADARAWQEGEADADAGRVVPHDAVVRWLQSWGTPDELLPPQCAE